MRTVMPIIRVEMHPGRTQDQRRAFVDKATKATVEALACPPESVEIIITEIPKEFWAKAGKLKSDG